MASCPSVCPSVTLRYRDHIGWNSWKIIPWLISLTFSLSADPNMTDLLQREHLQILAGIGVGLGIPIPDLFSQSRDSGLGNF